MVFTVSGYFWYEIYILIIDQYGNSFIVIKILSIIALTTSHTIVTSLMTLLVTGWNIRYVYR